MQTVEALQHDQIVFPRLGIDINVSDTAFTIFGMEIKWYGLIITTGMLLAMIYGFSQMKKYGLDPDKSLNAVIGGVVGGLVGARLYYVIMNWSNYKDDLLSVFNLRNGGLAIYGGIIGAMVVGGLVARFYKVKLLPLLDITSICFLLGQGMGRWGNFTNQEAFGCNTDNVFGMSGGQIQEWIKRNADTATLRDGQTLEWNQTVHPCFLYESLWCLLGFVLLVIFAKKIRKFDGQILLMYVGWYGLERFFVEGLRTDSLMIGSLRVSQALAAVCVIASVILLIVLGLKVRRLGTDYVMYVDTEESKQLLKEAEENKLKRAKEKDAEDSDEEAEDIQSDEENDDETDGVKSENQDDESDDPDADQ